MAISFIAGAEATSTGTAVTITHGLTLQTGDVLLAFIHDLHTSALGTCAPTGTYAFTNSRNASGGSRTDAGFALSTTGAHWVFHRVVTTPASETTADFTLSSSVAWSIVVMQFRGVHADVWDVKPDTAGQATSVSTTATAPDITLGSANATALLAGLVGTASYSNGTSGVNGSAININKDTVTNSYVDTAAYYTTAGRGQCVWYRNGLSAGAMGASSYTLYSSDEWSAIQCSLKQAAGGTPPTVTTTSITSITATSAASGGTITSQGDSAVTAYGVCWNTGGAPTIGDEHTHDGP